MLCETCWHIVETVTVHKQDSANTTTRHEAPKHRSFEGKDSQPQRTGASTTDSETHKKGKVSPKMSCFPESETFPSKHRKGRPHEYRHTKRP
jgi:hypothetical protein